MFGTLYQILNFVQNVKVVDDLTGNHLMKKLNLDDTKNSTHLNQHKYYTPPVKNNTPPFINLNHNNPPKDSLLKRSTPLLISAALFIGESIIESNTKKNKWF